MKSLTLGLGIFPAQHLQQHQHFAYLSLEHRIPCPHSAQKGEIGSARSLAPAGWLKINSSSRFCAQINLSELASFGVAEQPISSLYLAHFFCPGPSPNNIMQMRLHPHVHIRPRRSRRLTEKPYSGASGCTAAAPMRPLKTGNAKHPTLFFLFPLRAQTFFSIFLGVNTRVLLRWVCAGVMAKQ